MVSYGVQVTAELLGAQWAVVSALEYAFGCIKSHPTVKKCKIALSYICWK